MGLEAARSKLIKCLRREISDERVLVAMANIPRELFVSSDRYSSAYEDRPLSIGFGQTISQPLIVAMMTQALELKGDEKVLEIGTGSGYQTAILARLAKRVISVERIPELIESAKRILDKLGYTNIEIHKVNDASGWAEDAPYNAIIVTAGAPHIPDTLIEQLVTGGRLVIPVGSKWEQDLLRVIKNKKGNKVENMGGCRFVPLIGEGAWEI